MRFVEGVKVSEFNYVPRIPFKNLAGSIWSAKPNHIGSEEKEGDNKGDNKRGLFINS